MRKQLFDSLALIENEFDCSNELAFEGYNIFRKDRDKHDVESLCKILIKVYYTWPYEKDSSEYGT